MGRGKRRESRFLSSPSHRPPRASFFPSPQPSYDTKGPRRRGELTSDYFFVLRYTVYQLSTLTPLSQLCFCVITVFIRSLLGFKKPSTHASVLFVVKKQKSGECKSITSGIAIFLRSSWPSRSLWKGSKFRSTRAKLLYLFFLRKITPKRARLGLFQEKRGKRLDEDVAANARGGRDREQIAMLRINLFSYLV